MGTKKLNYGRKDEPKELVAETVVEAGSNVEAADSADQKLAKFC